MPWRRGPAPPAHAPSPCRSPRGCARPLRPRRRRAGPGAGQGQGRVRHKGRAGWGHGGRQAWQASVPGGGGGATPAAWALAVEQRVHAAQRAIFCSRCLAAAAVFPLPSFHSHPPVSARSVAVLSSTGSTLGSMSTPISCRAAEAGRGVGRQAGSHEAATERLRTSGQLASHTRRSPPARVAPPPAGRPGSRAAGQLPRARASPHPAPPLIKNLGSLRRCPPGTSPGCRRT